MYKIEETFYLQASISSGEGEVEHHFCIQLTEHYRLIGYWHQKTTIFNSNAAEPMEVLCTLEGLMNRKREVIINWTMLGPAETGTLFFQWPAPTQTSVEIKSIYPRFNVSEMITVSVAPKSQHPDLFEAFQAWHSFFTNKYQLHAVSKVAQEGDFTKALALAHELSENAPQSTQIINHVNAVIEKGSALISLGRYEEADQVLKECLQCTDQLDGTTVLLLQATLNRCAAKLLSSAPNFYTPQYTYLPDFKEWYHDANKLYMSGQYKEALDLYAKALSGHLQHEQPDWINVCSIYEYTGLCYLALGDLEQAQGYTEQALQVAQQQQLYPLISGKWTFQGIILQKRHRFQEAEAAFLNAIEWANRYTPDDKWSIYHLLAKCYGVMGAPAQAENCYEMAIQSIETQRSILHKDDNRITYYQPKAIVYQDYAHFKLQQKQYKAAFDLLQRARSRALLDLLQERHGRIGNESIANYTEIKASLGY